jgi:Uncharacterized conserved protein (DUF2190)
MAASTTSLRPIRSESDIRTGLNDSGSTITEGKVVRLSGAGADQIALPSADTDPVFGVTMEDIADDIRGDIQIGGRAVVTAGAAVSRGALLTMTTAGKVVTWTASGNRAVVGVANTAAGADGDSIEVELAGPGVFGPT